MGGEVARDETPHLSDQFNLGEGKMPRYDYRCNECGHIFEVNHSIKVNLEATYCNKCQKSCFVTRLMSRTSFRLRWRKTPVPGKRTPVKRIGNQLYDEDSYNKAKQRGRF